MQREEKWGRLQTVRGGNRRLSLFVRRLLTAFLSHSDIRKKTIAASQMQRAS
jgi:hypothetical protein